MKYLIAFVLAVSLSFGVAIPILADSGVSVTLTTTVVGGGIVPPPFISNPVVPYSPINWATIFPSMNQPQSSSPVDNRPIQNNPPITIPPVVPQSNNYVPPVVPVQEPTGNNGDTMVYLFIGLGSILIGLIVYLLIPD